jgi:hypothetical protein
MMRFVASMSNKMGITSGAGTAFAKNNRFENFPEYLHKLDFENANIYTLYVLKHI